MVFVPPEPPPPGHLRKAAQACISTLHGQQADPLARALFAAYFRQFYASVDLDRKKIVSLLQVEPATLGVQFRSAADAFRLIDDQGSALVVVRYAEHHDAMEKLLASAGRRRPGALAHAQAPALHRQHPQARGRHDAAARQPDAAPMPGLYVQRDVEGLYHPLLGLQVDDVPFNPCGLVF